MDCSGFLLTGRIALDSFRPEPSHSARHPKGELATLSILPSRQELAYAEGPQHRPAVREGRVVPQTRSGAEIQPPHECPPNGPGWSPPEQGTGYVSSRWAIPRLGTPARRQPFRRPTREADYPESRVRFRSSQ